MQLSSAYFPSLHFWDALYKLFNGSDNGTATDALQEIIRLDFPMKMYTIEVLLRGKRRQKILWCIRSQFQVFCIYRHDRKDLTKGGWGALLPTINSQESLHPKGVHYCSSLCELHLLKQLDLHLKLILPFNIHLWWKLPPFFSFS